MIPFQLPDIQKLTVTLEGTEGVDLDTFLACLYLESKSHIFGYNFDLLNAEKMAEERYREQWAKEQENV